MEDQNQAPQWAIVELMGHVKTGGLISKDTQLGTALLRLDVPRQDGRMVSQLINPASLYRVTFAEERLARAAAAASDPMPLHSWEIPQEAARLMEAKTEPEQRFCLECGLPMHNAGEFCPECSRA